MGSVSFECKEIPRVVGSQIDFGVEVTGLDIENVSGKEFFKSSAGLWLNVS